MARFSNRSLSNLKGVHPHLAAVMKAAIKDVPVDFTITEGVRTAQRQAELYSQGRHTSGNIVTNCDGVKKKSNHQAKADGWGYAVDLYPYVGGKVRVDDVASLEIIAEHIKATAERLCIPIEWGGDWKMKDYPHFELKCVL